MSRSRTSGGEYPIVNGVVRMGELKGMDDNNADWLKSPSLKNPDTGLSYKEVEEQAYTEQMRMYRLGLLP